MTLELFQAHTFQRGEASGMSCWVANRTSKSRKPDLYMRHEADALVEELVSNGHDPAKVRIVEN